MNSHKKILAILHIVNGTLLTITMLFVSVLLAVVMPEVLNYFSSMTDSQLPEVSNMILPILNFVVTAIIILFAIPSIIGGVALLNDKQWALTLLLVLGCFQLIFFPFGTAIGIYSIWVNAQDKKASWPTQQ